MSAPYVMIPQAVFAARDAGDITPEQVDIFSYCYWKAERPEYRVHSYSAASVCRFKGLVYRVKDLSDSEKAIIKKYERAAVDLLERRLIRRDYRRLSPEGSQRVGRTYSVWVPRPENFEHVGTAGENGVSIWEANVDEKWSDNVAEPVGVTGREEREYDASATDNVDERVVESSRILSIPYQRTKNIPLNPPTGDFSPSRPPQGGGAQAAGLNVNSRTGESQSLASVHREQLKNAVLLYADLIDWLYHFTPNQAALKEIANLFRHYQPEELLLVQLEKFPMTDTFNKKTMAAFFLGSAETLIKIARLKSPSRHINDLISFARESRICSDDDTAKDFAARWTVIRETWDKVFPKHGADSGI